MNYQWYPGHMTKARRMMQEDIKLIDLVIELVDARVPFSSRNPDIDELAKNKSRLILLNKSDLADKAKTARWVEYFQQKGFYVLELNAKTGAGMKAIDGVVKEACREKIERDLKRGIKNRPVRAMVVGIPNVGKSNKTDREGIRTDLRDLKADQTLKISAKTGAGLSELTDALEEVLRRDKIYVERLYPFDQAGIIQLIRKEGELVSEEYTVEGIEVRAYVPRKIYEKV